MKELELYNVQKAEGEMGDKTANIQTIGLLEKLYNIIIYICSSAGHTKEFKDLTERMIPLDNCTR